MIGFENFAKLQADFLLCLVQLMYDVWTLNVSVPLRGFTVNSIGSRSGASAAMGWNVTLSPKKQCCKINQCSGTAGLAPNWHDEKLGGGMSFLNDGMALGGTAPRMQGLHKFYIIIYYS